jgi:hypothetical protein
LSRRQLEKDIEKQFNYNDIRIETGEDTCDGVTLYWTATTGDPRTKKIYRGRDRKIKSKRNPTRECAEYIQ